MIQLYENIKLEANLSCDSMSDIKYHTYPCPHCGNYNKRGISIDAIIIKDNKILLIKRGKEPYKNLWALPGGHLDWNETLEDAVSREVKEETALNAIRLRFIRIYSQPKRHPKQAVAVAFEVKASGQSKAGDDAKELKYFPISKIPKKLAFDHEIIIGDYLRFNKLG